MQILDDEVEDEIDDVEEEEVQKTSKVTKKNKNKVVKSKAKAKSQFAFEFDDGQVLFPVFSIFMKELKLIYDLIFFNRFDTARAKVAEVTMSLTAATILKVTKKIATEKEKV